MVSVIIPTKNEIQHGYLGRILDLMSRFPDFQIVCVDGESSDGTAELIEKYPQFELHIGNRQSRGARLNKGLSLSRHDIVLFHHPRSILTPEGLNYLAKTAHHHHWGAFTHRFDVSHPFLRFTSWYSNYVRGWLKDVFYLDHCLFINKAKMPTNFSWRDVPIFEDTYFSYDARVFAPGRLLPFSSTTSPTRFLKNGMTKQAWINIKMKWGFERGYSADKMNKIYEKGLNFNSKYDTRT